MLGAAWGVGGMFPLKITAYSFRKGHPDRVMMIDEQSLPYLLGLPAEKQPTWSQIFYQQEKVGADA